MGAAPTIRIDRARCVCSEYCARLAPNTFETDDEGLVTILPGAHDPIEALRAAASSCPAQAITIDPAP